MNEEAPFGVRRLVTVCARSLPLLAPVKYHIGLFLLLAGGVGAVAAFFALSLGLDVLWEGVLRGSPIRVETARMLGLDPLLFAPANLPEAGVAASASVLGPELRLLLRDRLVMALGIAIAGVLPIAGAMAYYQLWILQKINQHLRTLMIARLQGLSLRFHAGAHVGDAIYRVYQDSAMVTNVIRNLILFPALQGVFMVSMAALLALRVDGKLVLWMLGLSLPFCLLISWSFSARMREGFRAAREANSALTSTIQESLSAIRLIKAFSAERSFEQRFDAASRTAFARAFEARNRVTLYTVLLFCVSGAVLTFAILVATEYTMMELGGAVAGLWAIGFTARTWNLGVYNTFQEGGRRVTQGIERLFGFWGQAQDIAAGLDRVFQLLDTRPEVADDPGAVELATVSRGIRFEDVSFAYQAGKPVLERVSFELPVGSVTALVGPTGAGKSTLLSLLLRLYDPDAGAIRIDRQDLRGYTVASIRSKIAIALQENVLFARTIRENIRYARPEASDAEVEAAARIACAHEFIIDLPERYDTQLGERGAKLSMGQRQRIGIARALLKDTPVLILDEPTASLDVETEQALMRNLALWGRARTLLIVTHRIETVRRADRIVVLREGRVAETGTHAELTAERPGVYRSLVAASEGARVEERVG